MNNKSKSTGFDNEIEAADKDLFPDKEDNLEDFSTWNIYSTEYLSVLKNTYQLDALTKDCRTDYEKVEKITKWVSGLWKHDGSNQPKQTDPLYILDQVINHGKQYRCVEYGVVICGCLQALGLDSRKLSLKMKDVETIEYSAGHVGCEVFLNDYKRWIFIDGQWGAIPMIGSTPINAYEFGKAICNQNNDLTINWINNVYNVSDKEYINWIEPYLFYLDTEYTDQAGNQKAVMFVPENGKEVTVFQRKYPIIMDHYVRNIHLFYSGQVDVIRD